MSETHETTTPVAHDEATSASFMPKAIGHTIRMPDIAEGVAKNIERAGFPEVNDTLIAAETERALSHIRAGTPLPIDGDASKGDAYFLSDVAASKDRTLQLQGQLTATEEKTIEARRILTQLLPPLTLQKWAVLTGALGVLTLIGVLTLKALLSSSFDELLYRPYYLGLNVADAEIVSAQHAEWLVIWTASFLLGGKALAVVGSSGRLNRLLKALLIAIAFVFSGAFAIVRLAEGGSLAAVAMSLVELTILFSYTLVLLALARVLERSAERGEAYRTAAHAAKLEEERLATLRQELTRASEEYEARRRALSQREDDCRRLPLCEAVARETVKAEALIATAELITKEAKAAYAGVLKTDQAILPEGDTP